MDNLLMLIFAVAALLGSALMQVILAVAGYRSRSERRARDSMLRTLQEEVLVLSSDIAASSRRLGQLERQLAGAGAYNEKPQISGPVGQAYEVAVNLVRKGADVDDLVETCGLSHGEAELIAGLYRTPAKGANASGTSQSSAREREVTARTGASAYEAAY